MSNESTIEFIKNNPTLMRLSNENIILETEIIEMQKQINRNKEQITFLREFRLNEGV